MDRCLGAVDLFQGIFPHPQVELLASESTDTGRSVMLRPLVPPRPRKYLLPEDANDANWAGERASSNMGRMGR